MAVKPLSPHDARERFAALIMNDALGLRYNKASEKYLYHYTNLAGFRGIVQSKSIWASDFRYMNDKSEFVFGLDILEMIIAEPGTGPAIERNLRNDVLVEIALMRRHRPTSLYVLTASFCKKGNVLSQWRYYGKENGVAICFDKEIINKSCSSQDFVFGPVRYFFHKGDKDGSDTTSESWLRDRIDRLNEAISSSSDGSRNEIIFKWIAETAAFIKHPAFAEEYEWRCVKVIFYPTPFNEFDIKERISGSNIIPYIDINIHKTQFNENISVFDAIRSVIIGPTSDPESTLQSVSHVMTRHGCSGDYQIDHPYTPLKV